MTQINKIDSAELYILKVPLVYPFVTSIKKLTHKEVLILKLNSEDYSGWGECTADIDPFYYYETTETAINITEKFLLPILFNTKNIKLEDIQYLFSIIRGHSMAKAMIENAILDLIAKKEETPLYKLIGGTHKNIMSGISIGIKKDINYLLKLIGDSINKKYHRIKLKIKKGNDIGLLKIIRENFPNIPIMVDANGNYSLDDVEYLKQLDKFNLMMIEQPFEYNDFYKHSLLQKELKTPVCLDESINCLNDAITAINLKSCKIINIKQGRLGGLLNAKTILEYCNKNNIDTWSGGMLETGIGRAFNLHLQTLSGFTLPGDTSETSRYFHEDIVAEPVVLNKDGFIDLPEGNGIGVKIVQKTIDRYKMFYRFYSPNCLR